MIDVSDMRTRLNDPDANADLLVPLIDGAYTYVEAQTRRMFRESTAVTEYLTGIGSRTMVLSGWMTADAEVAVSEREYPGATPTALVADTDFELRATQTDRILVRLGSETKWKDGYEYAVTYTTSGFLPEDIADLIAGLVALRYQLAGNESVRSESIAGYSYTRFGEGDLDAIPGARETIEAWRPPVLA